MRVLHVCEYVKGGIATYLNEVVKYQIENGIDVYIILSRHNSDNIDVILESNKIFYEYKRKPKFIFKSILKINQIIKELKPDIIHIHSTFAGLFTRLPFLIKKRNSKIVYCSHGWSFLMDTSHFKRLIYSFIEKVLSMCTDLIINISKYEFDKSIEVGLPVGKSTLIYNGISEKLREKPVELMIDIDKSKINLLFIGRFDKQKGIDILLDFFRVHEISSIDLYIIGDSVLKNQTLEVPHNVHHLGWVDHQSIDTYYKLFDAVIIPSRWEGFGLVAIEAMKNRKAVIASNKGALPELVINNKNGFLFDIDNLDSLKKIIDNLDKQKLAEMGEIGHQIFLNKFTSEKMNEKLIQSYKLIK
jgi:glycosyltransferase involved in cell wall biosynthesis